MAQYTFFCVQCADETDEDQPPFEIVPGKLLCHDHAFGEDAASFLVKFRNYQAATVTDFGEPVHYDGRLIDPEPWRPYLGDEFLKKYTDFCSEQFTPYRRRRYCREINPETGEECKAFVYRCGDPYMPRSSVCCACGTEACCICGAPLGDMATHECVFVPDPEPPLVEDSAEYKRGREWQYCPHSQCGLINERAAGCNAIVCVSWGCRTEFCVCCGKKATHDSDHWKLGSQCPRFSNLETGGGIFDADGKVDPEDAQPEREQSWPPRFQLWVRAEDDPTGGKNNTGSLLDRMRVTEEMRLTPSQRLYNMQLHSGWFAIELNDYLRQTFQAVPWHVPLTEYTESILHIALLGDENALTSGRFHDIRFDASRAKDLELKDDATKNVLFPTFIDQLESSVKERQSYYLDFISRLWQKHSLRPNDEGHVVITFDDAWCDQPLWDIRPFGVAYRKGAILEMDWNLFLERLQTSPLHEKSLQPWVKTEAYALLRKWLHSWLTQPLRGLHSVRIRVFLHKKKINYFPVLVTSKYSEEDARAAHIVLQNRIEPLFDHWKEFMYVMMMRKAADHRAVAQMPRPFIIPEGGYASRAFVYKTRSSTVEEFAELWIPLNFYNSRLDVWFEKVKEGGSDSPTRNPMQPKYGEKEFICFPIQTNEDGHIDRVRSTWFYTRDEGQSTEELQKLHAPVMNYFRSGSGGLLESLDWIFQRLREEVPRAII